MAVLRTLGIGCLAVLGIAGCAGMKPSAEQEAARADAQETIDQILSTPLESAEYGEVERCISTFQYDRMEILDDRHVLFKGRGDRMWLNQLRTRCVGLRRESTPVIRLRDSQICDMDTFQGVDDMFGVLNRTSATCSLGTFTPITDEQADAIKAALKEARAR